MITIEELNGTVEQINKAARVLRDGVFSGGKPDWMPQEMWDNISPKEYCTQDDCQRDKDSCCDCHEGDLYKSPDKEE